MTDNNQQPAMPVSPSIEGGDGVGLLKRCTRCKKEKSIEEFYLFTSRKDGSQRRDYYCKDCRRYSARTTNLQAAKRREAHRRALRDVGEGMKRCPCCNRALPLDAYYKNNRNGTSTYCKDCTRDRHRALREKKRKCGVFRNEKDGRLHVFGSKGNPKLYWDGNMLSILRRYYPNTSNVEVAELIGVSTKTLVLKARELGITKDREYLRQIHAASIALNGRKRGCRKSV